MESANLHHQHQLPDQLAAGSTSSLATPCPSQSFYGFGSNNHLWTSTTTFSTIGNLNPNYNGVVSNLRDSRHKSDNNLVSHPLNSSTTSSVVQDLGFHWNSNASGSFYNQSAHDLEKIKEEQSFPKFTEMLNTSPSRNMDGDYYSLPTSHHVKNEHKGLNELSEKLLLKTLSSSCQINGHQISTGEFLSDTTLRGTSHVQGMPGRGQFSQIYPSINISNLNQSSLSSAAAVSSSLDMSLRALDHLATTTATFSGSLNQPLNDIGISSYGLHQQMEQSHRLSSCAHRKIPSFNNEVTEAKRPGNLMEPKASQAHASKKTRLESRTSCPPFKVRKEKLGDRIAALQQLVAPFGKTDTASVLMEAIGYIKFLQNQVETLSVPYMKSSSTKSYKTMKGAGMKVDDGNDEPKRDLRSRGLCLVPLTCMSYVTGEGSGGSVWPPPNFGGET